MRKTISITALFFTLIFTACASNNQVAYDAQNHNKIKQVTVGQVLSIREVYIKDDGSGALVGTVIGTVLGSTVGGGDGTTLAALGGGIVGAVVGNTVNKTNAQELTVSLEDGKTIVVLSKGTALKAGDKIRIISVDNEVSSVYKI